jgi:molybdenum cofactor cytidylyltransferase
MISAIVLAAGLSTRMGTQKMLLPWGQTTVIEKVLSSTTEAGLSNIYVVTGSSRAVLMKLLQGRNLNFIFNKDFANGEMLTSIQVGLKALSSEVEAVLIVLGDQPQIEARVVKEIITRFQASHHPIIVPSYKMHRGHPWLIEKTFWKDVLALKPPLTLRDFLNSHHKIIDYVNINTSSILEDLDTQEDYSQFTP